MAIYRRKHNRKLDRVTLIKVLFFVLAGAIIARLFYLQIIKHAYYVSLANARHMAFEELKPERGKIFVLDNGKLDPVALNQKLYLFYGVPANISNATATVALIEKVLPVSAEKKWQIFLKLSKHNDPYEPIWHYVTQEQKERLEKLKIQGTGFRTETKRIYPQNNLFSDVLGFVGYKDNRRVGQYGIEEYFENELAGKMGELEIEKDPQGRLISFGKNKGVPAKDGINLVLTLNPTIQFKVCSILEDWRKKMLAEDGTAVVIEPSTGRILAMCDKPDFDLNNYSQVKDMNIYFNKSVNEAYEPGSIFKVITMAAALDLGRVDPSTKYEDKGFVKFGPRIIRNAANKTYGVSTMTQVLEKSINTGAVFAVMKVGHKNFKKYVEKFGFGKKTGITLPFEDPGDISNLNRKGDIYIATASYGQGILATPLQMAMAYAAVANNGILMRPQIVLGKVGANGKIEANKPQEVRRVISSKTANILKAMLVSVVKNGHGKRANVKGYYVAGKTGTANIANPHGGGYYKDQTNHTFIGFAPVDKTKFVVLVKLSKPKNVRFSADSCAPAVGEIIKYLLQYYQIPPDY